MLYLSILHALSRLPLFGLLFRALIPIMANEVFERSFTGNQPLILAQEMKFAGLYQTPWARWTSIMMPDGEVKSLTGLPTTFDSPILMKHELEKEMGDNIRVPLHRDLVALPKHGVQQLEGFEEKPRINHMDVAINTIRTAEKTKEGKIMTQRTKDYALAQRARPALQRHWSRTASTLMWSYAMYNRFSWNILDDTDFDADTTIEAVSHPHIFMAGQGKVSYTSGFPSSDNYETAVGTAIDAMDPASHVLNFALLQQLKAHPIILKIEPITDAFGNDLRLLLVNPRSLITLENDPVFRDLALKPYAGSGVGGSADNPALFGAKYCVEGFAIFPFHTAVFEISTSAGQPVYGPATITDLDSFESHTQDIFGNIILGKGALYGAMGDNMVFIEANRDYMHVHGIAYDIMTGAARADFVNYDDGTQGGELINESSALVFCGAPALDFS